jgi:hypothetical protein
MSDDVFIREVNEEIRQDKAKALWDRFGPFVIGLALLVIAGTAALVAYDYWQQNRSGSSGDAFSQALTLAGDGKHDEALSALEALEKEGHGAYPVLARLRSATVLADKGDAAGAVADLTRLPLMPQSQCRSAIWPDCALHISSSIPAPIRM